MDEQILKISLREYREEIKLLQAEMLGLDQSSEKYKQTAREVSERQRKLNDVMRDSRNNIEHAKGSYNDLVQQMANLKKAWRETGDELVRNDLGKKIAEINAQLKGMDASVGNFQRNVGNYQSAFGEMGQMFQGVEKQVIGGLTNITKNIPIIGNALGSTLGSMSSSLSSLGAVGTGVLAGLAVAIGSLTYAIHEDKESYDEWAESIGITNGLLDHLKSGAVWVGNQLIELASGAVNTLTYAFYGLELAVQSVLNLFGADYKGADALEERMSKETELAKKEVEIFNKKVELTRKEGDENRKIAEQRAKMMDAEVLSEKEKEALGDRVYEHQRKNIDERKKAGEEAYKTEQLQLKERAKLAEDEYNYIKEKNRLSSSSREDVMKEAEAYKKMQDAQGAVADSERQWYRQRKRLDNERKRVDDEEARDKKKNADDNKRAQKEADRLADDMYKREKQRLKDLANLRKELNQLIEKGFTQGSNIRLQYTLQGIVDELNERIKMAKVSADEDIRASKGSAEARLKIEQDLEEKIDLMRKIADEKRAQSIRAWEKQSADAILKNNETIATEYKTNTLKYVPNRPNNTDKDSLPQMEKYYEAMIKAQDLYNKRVTVMYQKAWAERERMQKSIEKLMTEMNGVDQGTKEYENLSKALTEANNKLQELTYVQNDYFKMIQEGTDKLGQYEDKLNETLISKEINKVIKKFNDDSSLMLTDATRKKVEAEKEFNIAKINLEMEKRYYNETQDEFDIRKHKLRVEREEALKEYAKSYYDMLVDIEKSAYEFQKRISLVRATQGAAEVKDSDTYISKNSALTEDSAMAQAKLRVKVAEWERDALEKVREKGLIGFVEYYDRLGQLRKEEINAQYDYVLTMNDTYTAMADGISSTLGAVADIMETNIKQKQKDGKISEKEAKKEFERVKKLQIAQTVINTLSGAVGAYLQDVKTYPSPYGQIIGGIDMASALALGFAQIKQIQATQIGSSTANGSSGVATQTVSPLLNEQIDKQNLLGVNTGLISDKISDQRVYILESDIQSSNRRVETRESETSF